MAAPRLVAGGALVLCGTSGALAQIRTDASLGHAPQSLVGPNYVIPQNLGLVAGGNLFDSFSVFNLAAGEQATFTTSSAGIANIISRVTGGSASTINGNINVNAAAGAPNFFFVNPAGITFGAGASINVPAAIHLSTANYVKFADGRFYSDLAHVSTFSTLAPEAFGFLGTTRAALNIGQDSFIAQGEAPISLVAGDISVSDGATVATFGGGDVRVAAVGSDAVEVPFSGALPVVHGTLSVSNGGSIAAVAAVTDSGNVLVSAGQVTMDGMGSNFFTGIYTDAPAGSTGNAGVVTLTAQSLGLINSAAISSTTESTGNAAGIVGNVHGAVTLASDAQIYSAAYDSGSAGAVSLSAGTLAIDGGGPPPPAAIYSFARAGTGNAGAVNVSTTGGLTLTHEGFIGANSYTSGAAGTVVVNVGGVLSVSDASEIVSQAVGSGPAGSVTVQAASIVLQGAPGSFTGIASDSEGAQSGPAGSVVVTTPGSLAILGGADISSGTSSSYDAGSVVVSAATLTIDGQGAALATGISTNALYAQGGAGLVRVNVAGALEVLDGGTISSQSEASFGNAGSIKVTAGSLTIDNQGNPAGANISTSLTSANPAAKGGDIMIDVKGLLELKDSGEISADTYYEGDAGTVSVHAGSVLIQGDGAGSLAGISSQSIGTFSGNAGSVEVSARGSLSVLDAGTISSSTFSRLGRAGTVDVTAEDILVDGFVSSINAEALPFSSGQTGDVTIQATHSITVADRAELSISNGATVSQPGRLSATELDVSAPYITLSNGALIAATALGNTAASDITVHFGDILRLDPSGISTSSFSGNGGSIRIEGGDLIELDQSQITTSVLGRAGNGGDITVQSDVLVLDSGFIQANTAAAKASGGNVFIDAGALLSSGATLFVGGSTAYLFAPRTFGFNVIQAAAPTGISGTIEITNPELDLAGSLAPLGGRVLDAGGLARDRCAGAAGSSLVEAGQGGLAPAARGLVRADPEAPLRGAASSPNRSMPLAFDCAH